MSVPSRIAIWLVLLMPVASMAESLRVQLPEHRVLSSSETESFESALIEQLAKALGRSGAAVARADDAEVRLVAGDRVGPATYYHAVPAALSATEGGLVAWSDLQGQTVCVNHASPYGALLSERFAALPREYPSAAHALIGLKLGECVAVVEDDLLLMEIATLPEWRRYKHLLPSLADVGRPLGLNADDANLQQQINALLAQWSAEGRLAGLIQQWVDEVAFQAYVLADMLDCH
ncbi:transporter substrate-binding domain-containing protein [Pseudomonas stutzeri]|jgi:polar amino acid transport system substrate-binding protein|uniref:Amino acid ABC transporter periplasmic amino acid-binding protein n=1 Tax=Stutzerimonas stutzeri NF13 TaxID=1212548 RepID=M2ULJ0_STUST|nr:transporter substrate-binding domain-containing protein [Stutzerimonas stutzeri]EMD99389.1 amino acid ABC transporter periplasmic amino acid-binding protein [Stutzerimonas stutzeri NF13]MBK3883198.1 transporter substrate-binding domain-containing protein [Stutzerimonas stutzeri]WOF79592.1 transporter substrate-binding domain-containing protein [Pseudomonas sp. FeN3W]